MDLFDLSEWIYFSHAVCRLDCTVECNTVAAIKISEIQFINCDSSAGYRIGYFSLNLGNLFGLTTIGSSRSV